MKINKANYLGIYHNPFQYKQKHDLIFHDVKSKRFVIALTIEEATKEEIEEYFLENYEVLLSNCFEDSIYEFESDQLSTLENVLELL